MTYLNKDESKTSSRKSRWKVGQGSTLHAIVSVMAVKSQFSSPIGVFLSDSIPGSFSASSTPAPPKE